MWKKTMYILLSAVLLLEITGCNDSPKSSVVASKNDGRFEEIVRATSIPFPNDTHINDAESEYLQLSESFTNTDGSLKCDININSEQSILPMPIIQVRPHEITADEAKRIAQVLFEGATFYDYSEEMSKQEIEELILDIKQKISDWDSLVEYYDGDETLAQNMLDAYTTQIENYSALYNSAPEYIERKVCDWEFHPISYYEDTIALQSTTDDFDSYNQAMYIKATTIVNDKPYSFSVCNRNGSDFQVHSIFAYLDLPGSTSSHYSEERPTSEEVDNTCEYVEEILEKIEPNKWKIDSCKIGESMSNGTYNIYIQATPEYNGVSVAHQEQPASLKTDDSYAPNYYYETLTFDFSGGDLISFEYQAPLEVVSEINSNVEIISLENSVKSLKDYLGTQTVSSISSAGPLYDADHAEYNIDEVVTGLVRIRLKDNVFEYLLVPAYSFFGSYKIYDSEGNVLEDSKSGFEERNEIAIINAVDGSIINSRLGY